MQQEKMALYERGHMCPRRQALREREFSHLFPDCSPYNRLQKAHRTLLGPLMKVV
jgi:hypothetical protein